MKSATNLRDPRWAPTGRTLAVLVATAIIGVGQTYSVIPLLPGIAEDFGTSVSAASWTITAFSLCFAVGFLLAGPAADRFGPRRVILLGLTGSAAATLAVSLAENLITAVNLRCVQGATVAMLAPTGFAYAADRIDPARRPVAYGVLSSAGLAAAVLMQVAAQTLAPLGWRAVFIASGIAMLVLAAAARILLITDTDDRADSMLTAIAAVPRLLLRPRLLALYAATSTLLGSFVLIYTALELAGPRTVADDSARLLALRASALPAAVAAPLLIRAGHRFSARTKACTALALAAAAAVAAGMASHQIVALGAALLLFVGGIAVAAPSLVELIHAAGSDAIGAATALYTASLFVGTSVGPQVAAGLAPVGFGAATWSSAAILTAGALITLLGGRSTKTQAG